MSTDKLQQPLLVVEDDLALQKQIKWSLDRFESVTAHDRESAMTQVRRYSPAVVTMDLGLPPDADSVSEGFKLLEQILAAAPDTKVIVLTGQNDQSNAVKAVGMGAYDFLAKPFELAELEARLTALVRRARGSEHPRLACGPLQFDTVTRQFTLSAEPLQLSPREHALLKALVQRSGEPLTRQQAMDRVFGDDEDVQPSVIDVLLHRLRKRLEDSGVRIHTYRGLGYVLELDTPGQH